MCRQCLDEDLNLFALGYYYGYPRCCIKAFAADVVKMYATGIAPTRQRGKGTPWYGTGFIPCDKHAEEIRKRDSLDDIELEISETRECPEPFPGDPEKQELWEELRKQLKST